MIKYPWRDANGGITAMMVQNPTPEMVARYRDTFITAASTDYNGVVDFEENKFL